MHVLAAKAVCLKEALSDDFKVYQRQVIANARALAQALIEGGLRLVSGGTDNHLILLDVRPKNLTGKEAEAILESVNITVNKNGIPFDPEKPTVTSGVRLGSPALTSRGLQEQEMAAVGSCISSALSDHSAENLDRIRETVKDLCVRFPLYA